jgi:hypothetical protein
MRVAKVVIRRQGGKEGTVLGQRTAVRMKKRLLRSVACLLGSSFGYVTGNTVHECVKFVGSSERLCFLVVYTSLSQLRLSFVSEVVVIILSYLLIRYIV